MGVASSQGKSLIFGDRNSKGARLRLFVCINMSDNVMAFVLVFLLWYFGSGSYLLWMSGP